MSNDAVILPLSIFIVDDEAPARARVDRRGEQGEHAHALRVPEHVGRARVPDDLAHRVTSGTCSVWESKRRAGQGVLR